MEQMTLDIDGVDNTIVTEQTALSLAEKVERSKTALRLAAEMSKNILRRAFDYCI